ncbi:hypothetical protein SS50377_27657 [Spironucleus salmonicida]|nr:hypothetical protein SS50377_27657 [Spironucleus salmonicida]
MSTYFTENEQTLHAQLLNRYQQAHQKFPQQYPKSLQFNKNSNILNHRLTNLLLDKQYNNYREAIVRSLNVVEKDEEILFDDFAQSYMQERAALAEDARMYGKDKLKVTLGGPKAPTYQMRRVQVCSCSDLLTREALAANDLLQQEETALLVYLNDEECRCPVPHTPNHISPQLFEKFLLFTRHPFIVQELANIDEILEDHSNKSEFLLQSILDMLVGKRKQKINILEEWRNIMESKVVKEVLKEFELAIQAIKGKYEKLLQSVLNKLNDNYSEILVNIMQFYENQMKICTEKVSVFSKVQLQNDNIIIKQKHLTNINTAIFQPFQILPNLLTSALALESDKFIDACIVNIALNIDQQEIYGSFILSECQLITPEICRKILQKIQTQKLGNYYKQAISNGSIKLEDFQSENFQKEIITYSQKNVRYNSQLMLSKEKEKEDMTITMLQYQQSTQSNSSFESLNNVPLRNCLIPFEYLIEEVNARKVVLKQEYSKLSEQNLKDLINQGQEAFPELLQEILDERIQMLLSKTYNNINSNQLVIKYDKSYSLDPSLSQATVSLRNQFIRIQPNKYLTNKSQSKIYVEILLKDIKEATVNLGIFDENNQDQLVYITSDGYVQTMTEKKYLGFELPENCIISILVDCYAQIIEYKSNGQRLQCSDGTLLEVISFQPMDQKLNNKNKLSNKGFLNEETLQNFLDIYNITQKSKDRQNVQEIQNQANKLDNRNEIEFYIGAEVYKYGKQDISVKFQFGEPYLLKCPAGYGSNGWK